MRRVGCNVHLPKAGGIDNINQDNKKDCSDKYQPVWSVAVGSFWHSANVKKALESLHHKGFQNPQDVRSVFMSEERGDSIPDILFFKTYCTGRM